MSWVSDLIRRLFSRHNNENVMDIARRLLGKFYEEVIEFAEQVIAALENADTNKDGKLDKAEIAYVLIDGLAKQLGVKLPGWVINGIVEYLVQRLRIPEIEVPVHTPDPLD